MDHIEPILYPLLRGDLVSLGTYISMIVFESKFSFSRLSLCAKSTSLATFSVCRWPVLRLHTCIQPVAAQATIYENFSGSLSLCTASVQALHSIFMKRG